MLGAHEHAGCEAPLRRHPKVRAVPFPHPAYLLVSDLWPPVVTDRYCAVGHRVRTLEEVLASPPIGKVTNLLEVRTPPCAIALASCPHAERHHISVPVEPTVALRSFSPLQGCAPCLLLGRSWGEAPHIQYANHVDRWLERHGYGKRKGVVVLGGGEGSGPLYPPPVIDEDMFTADIAAELGTPAAFYIVCVCVRARCFACACAVVRGHAFPDSRRWWADSVQRGADRTQRHRLLWAVRLFPHLLHPRHRSRRFGQEGCDHLSIRSSLSAPPRPRASTLTPACLAGGGAYVGEGGAWVEQKYHQLLKEIQDKGGNDNRDPNNFPVNTHGGLLAFGAPWEVLESSDLLFLFIIIVYLLLLILTGFFGQAPAMYNVIEAVEQLRGRAGSRQVRNAKRALVYANGGIFSASSIALLGVGHM